MSCICPVIDWTYSGQIMKKEWKYNGLITEADGRQKGNGLLVYLKRWACAL
jgi:hypothetical protein